MNSVNAEPGNVPLSPDMITTSPLGVIISQSAKGDRVTIYANDATDQGKGRAYRPPQGAKVVESRVWQQYVLISANGPRGAQLATYDFSQDKWATVDLRGRFDQVAAGMFLPGEEKAGAILVASLLQGFALDPNRGFRSRSIRLVPVLDFDRAVDEQGGTSPLVKDRVAAYVMGRHVYAYAASLCGAMGYPHSGKAARTHGYRRHGTRGLRTTRSPSRRTDGCTSSPRGRAAGRRSIRRTEWRGSNCFPEPC